MSVLPREVLVVIVRFAPLFSKSVWAHAQVLLIGAILAPGKRTVTAVLRVMGLSHTRQFQNYHRVRSRAVWSSSGGESPFTGRTGGHVCPYGSSRHGAG